MTQNNGTRLKSVMAAVLEVPEEMINEDSSPDDIESWDSLKHMNLILALEDEFNVEFSEDETVELLSYKLITLVLQEHGVSGIKK
jgi:acyl carrier protein